MKPTREQIKVALEQADKVGPYTQPEPWDSLRNLAVAYRATCEPTAIIGRTIGYIIAASLLLLSIGGLIWAAKMAIRMVAG